MGLSSGFAGVAVNPACAKQTLSFLTLSQSKDETANTAEPSSCFDKLSMRRSGGGALRSDCVGGEGGQYPVHVIHVVEHRGGDADMVPAGGDLHIRLLEHRIEA